MHHGPCYVVVPPKVSHESRQSMACNRKYPNVTVVEPNTSPNPHNRTVLVELIMTKLWLVFGVS